MSYGEDTRSFPGQWSATSTGRGIACTSRGDENVWRSTLKRCQLSCDVPGTLASRAIVGFRVHGRNGELGVVVDLTGSEEANSRLIVVRGGVSNALTYYVPVDRVRAKCSKNRTVHVDIDLADFVPHLEEDGTIELRTHL